MPELPRRCTVSSARGGMLSCAGARLSVARCHRPAGSRRRRPLAFGRDQGPGPDAGTEDGRRRHGAASGAGDRSRHRRDPALRRRARVAGSGAAAPGQQRRRVPNHGVAATERRERYRAVGRTSRRARRGSYRAVDPADGLRATRPRRRTDGTRWACTLAEDFDGTELDRTVWMPHDRVPVRLRQRPALLRRRPVGDLGSDGALHLSVRELPEPPVLPRLKQRADRVRRRHGVDVPAVQPAVRPLRGADQEHRHRAAGAAGGVLAVARRPLRLRRYGPPPARSTSPRPTRSIRTWPSRSCTTPSNDNGGPDPGLNTAWNCPAHAASSTPTRWSGPRPGSRSWSTGRAAWSTPPATRPSGSPTSSRSPRRSAPPATRTTAGRRCPRR